MEQEERIKRVARMEDIFNDAQARLRALDEALAGYEAGRKAWDELTAYYEGPDWRVDFEADERGEFPPDMRRGVLSEDAVYDLMMENDALLERMRALCGKDEAQ